ncbi:uncharacterized protein LOC114519145 isoform X2 [Dendronephthya gigantea]|uniref:uncharacterized protein LOC114519145 isoform X2 n=1 Tax=Dendronephthya gigantea TaxID=151771 RepID=UPI00106ABCA2|nr:uncharacterized protein LOC114519145 isoform X2 [Dendronephthya gigantea]
MGWLEKEEYNTNKSFLKKSKFWKKCFCVLRRYDGDSNVYLQWFEKEEDWRREFPKGSFGLFPKYSVYKHKTDKGKNYFEVSNDEEAHYFLANNETTMDLWVIQLMMQTRLNSSMIETSFRVKGAESKHLQRIGAKNLNCLLHLSEWGITLALERTHSVLSQWPLTTIRNYECTDSNEFVFEAGRKSPMGEGKYELLTTNSEDNLIFDQLDHYTSLRASRFRSAGGRNRLNSANDEEIAQAYGQLRWSVMLTSSQLNLGVINTMPSQPQAIVQNNHHQGVYDHLERKSSIQSTSTAVAVSYDRLDRSGSLSDRLSLERSYSRLNNNKTPPHRSQSQRSIQERNISDSYDHLERTLSFDGSPSKEDSRSRSFGSLERTRFKLASPPPEDSYSHLSRHRHASLPSSSSPRKNMEFYDKLDRSTANLDQGSIVNSYDRLNSMQGSVMLDRDIGMSPPTTPSNDPNAYDTFGNKRAHTPSSYPFVKPGFGAQDTEPLVVELPPPLPHKPSFMSGSGQKASISSEKKNEPLPPRPPVNEQDKPLGPEQDVFDLQSSGENLENRQDTKMEGNIGSLYQSVDDEESKNNPETNGSHYQAVDDQKIASEYDEPQPRGRLNTHSSNPDLTKISWSSRGTLDPSKRTTLHRSAPSLALYSVVDKKKGSKGSPKLSKSGSTFKLFKKIGRSSKKEEDSYEKVPRKNKKSQKRDNKILSTSSLKPLVAEDDTVSYVDIDGEESAIARDLMERRDSKRPLPDLPAASTAAV